MPLLPWRTDADGFQFKNTWTFDTAEQGVLAGLAAAVAPAAVAQVAALDPAIAADPALMSELLTASLAAGGITAAVTLPTYGLCGGMTYSSLDYWLAKTALPSGGQVNDQPLRTIPTQAPVRSFIWNRLIDSLTSGGCLQQTIAWSLVLNQLPQALGGGAQRLLAWTQNEWPKIKSSIDAGTPCPIGLLYAGRNIWDQHQILVYGYDSLSHGARLYVYDCNKPHAFGDTAFDPQKDFITFDLSGATLRATSPGDWSPNTLAGFFATKYSPKTPPGGLDTSFGKFVTWDGLSDFMTAYGAALRIANPAELSALGGMVSDPRLVLPPMPSTAPHPRDNALLREHSAAPVFLYQGGAPFHVPDPAQLTKFGGWSAVRVVPDMTLSQFAGSPRDGTLLREFSDNHVFVWHAGAFIPSQVPPDSVDVRLVPDGAIQSRLLDRLSLGYSAIASSGTCPGTVSLKTAFAGADIAVALTSSDPAAVTVPPSVTIPKGSTTSQPFTVTSTGTPPAAANLAVQITGTVGESAVSGSIIIEPPAIADFTIAPQAVTTGQNATATLTLAAPYAAQLQVNLLPLNTFADVQASVPIPAHQTTVTFPITTPARNYAFPPQTVQIQASYANINATAQLTVEPSVVAGIVHSVTLNPSLVPNGGQTTATVTLVSAVNVPTTVNLTSLPALPATQLGGSPPTEVGGQSPLIANLPNQITIPAGSTQGTFVIKTKNTAPAVRNRTALIEAIAIHLAFASLTLEL